MMRFSIITVNYNNEPGLQTTIDSVMGQTCSDYEWIVIDGGSSDGSKELIEKHRSLFSYSCSEPDNGVYHAMNKGVAYAKGDYLLFLNSGDAFYDSEVLSKVAALQSDADIITGQVERMDNHELLRRIDDDILMQLYCDTLSHQGSFIKRQLFDKYQYDEHLKIVSDWKFWMDNIFFGQAKVEVLPWKVALQDMSGISSANDASNVTLQQQERQEIIDRLVPQRLQNTFEHYRRLREEPYIVFGNYLRERSHILYAIGYRLLRFLTKLV